MNQRGRIRERSEVGAGFDAIVAADGYLVAEAMSHYRWERRGLLGRLLRTPIAHEASQGRPSLRRAA
jgi:hypothetical protein